MPATIQAIDDGQPNIAQLRPYSPDLLAFFGRFGQATSNYDANGHYLRVQPAGMNFFNWNAVTSMLDPIADLASSSHDFDNGFFNRCPGGSTQPIAGSNPFLDDGAWPGSATRRRAAGTMRRIAAIVVAVAASAAILVAGSGAGGDEGTYEVRAIFDNGAFLVEGEEVRIAGANVGDDQRGRRSPAETRRRTPTAAPIPGKAVVVLEIDDPGFQDFRADASCLIRPQSLLGEKFVECEPTQPRAAGSEPPPPLELIAEGEPGEGQRFLPLETNGKAVDLDLVNNIMREPYADRFRLILNDLGAGLAARGDELAEIIERSDPALRETNAVLAILARQNQALAEPGRATATRCSSRWRASATGSAASSTAPR